MSKPKYNYRFRQGEKNWELVSDLDVIEARWPRSTYTRQKAQSRADRFIGELMRTQDCVQSYVVELGALEGQINE